MYRAALLRAFACATLLAASPLSAATFVVTSSADTAGSTCGSVCTLRQAITAANATAATDTIAFNLAGSELQRIVVASNLPTITEPVSINGYTQAGALPNALDEDASNAVIRIWLDAGPAVGNSGRGLAVCSAGVSIRGLAVTGFAQRAIGFGETSTGSICAGATGGLVGGNFLGLDPLGRGAAAPFRQMIANTASSAQIGGADPAERNVIAGGVTAAISANNGSDVVVDGNLIGVDPTGSQARGSSGIGIEVSSDATGSLGLQRANLIANVVDGIVVRPTSRAEIGGNRFDASDLPIDLNGDGVTANDANDGDTGGNNLQNFPVLTLARRGFDSLLVEGSLDRPAGSTALQYRITLYASASCDASGHGPGERALGSQQITLANGASETFSITLNGIEPLFLGTAITAVATDSAFNSSEMSACLAVSESPTALLVSNTATSGAGSLRAAMDQANGSSSADIIAFNIPGAGPHVIPSSGLPQSLHPVMIDGYSQPGSSRNTLASGASNAQLRIVVNASGEGNGSAALPLAQRTIVRGLAIIEIPDGARGIELIGSSPGSRVEGCFIGLDPSGNFTGATTGDGIVASAPIQVGGTRAEQRNVFGGVDLAFGVFINGINNSVVEGNLIGTAPDGTSARNIGCGVRVSAAGATVSNVRIGGTLPDQQNRIANSTANCGAVSVIQGSGSVTGATLGNGSHSNQSIGIDLGEDGVTANDLHDADTGPNGRQNFPELHLAQPATGLGLRVRGRLDIPQPGGNARFTLSFYESAACDASGHGEGTIFLGSQDVALTDIVTPLTISTESFVVHLDANPALGNAITATATAPNGSTSEFSRCTQVASADTLMRNGFE